MQADPNLAQIAGATNPPGLLLRFAQGGQQKSHQDYNHADDYQQLKQRKGLPRTPPPPIHSANHIIYISNRYEHRVISAVAQTPNDGTDRRRRTLASELETDAARPRSVQ